MTSRRLHLNRETVRILTSSEMANVAGGAVPKTLICGPDLLTNFACPVPRPTDRCTEITKGCPILK
jgi:hypothetical protein